MALKSEVLPLLGLPTSATPIVRLWREMTSSAVAQSSSAPGVPAAGYSGARCRRSAAALPVAVPGMMAVVVMSSGKVFVHFAVGEYDDHVGLGTAQRDVVAHDFIFDRVFQGCVEQYFDPLPANESHLHDAPAEASVARHLEDRGRLARF